MKIFACFSTALVIFILSCVLPACHNRSQANAVNAPSRYAGAIDRAKKGKRYMVLHSGINIYSITSVEVDRTKQQLTVQLDKVDSSYLPVSSMQNAGEKRQAHTAVHIFMTDSTSYTLDEPHTILLEKVARIERID